MQRGPLAKLRRVLEQRQWVALDTETTALGPRAELVELALVAPDGSEFQTLIRPRTPVSRDASQIHRIPESALLSAPPFDSLAGEIRRRMTGRTVLGYHVDFDRRALWRAMATAGQPAPPCRWLCLSEVVTRFTGRRMSLSDALSEFRLEPEEPRHRALTDAQSAVKLARALAAIEARR